MLARINSPNRPTALIADPDLAFCRAAGHVLEGLGMRVVKTWQGSKALLRARSAVACIVLDLTLNKPDGLTVVETIRQERGPDLPIFVVTRLPIRRTRGWW